MDIKRNLRIYMTHFPGSFVGFFNLTSDIVKDLANEWIEHSKVNKDKFAEEWGKLLVTASDNIKSVSAMLEKLKTDFDNREVGREKEENDPITLIHKFREKLSSLK